MDTETAANLDITKSPPPPAPPPQGFNGEEDLSEKDTLINRLKQEIRTLTGKIRGYTTLSEICHEYKEKSKRLEMDLNQLKSSLDFENFKKLKEELAQVKELLDERTEELQNCKQKMYSIEQPKTSIDTTQASPLKNSNTVTVETASSIHAEISQRQSPTPEKSLDDDTDITNKSNSEPESHRIGDLTSTDPFSAGHYREVTPMQESMTPGDNLFNPNPEGAYSGNFQMVPSNSSSDDLMLFSGEPSKSIYTLSDQSAASSKEALHKLFDKIKETDMENLDSSKAQSLCKHMKQSVTSLQEQIHSMEEEIKDKDKYKKVSEVLQEELKQRDQKIKELEFNMASLTKKKLKSSSPESISSETHVVSGSGWVNIQKESEALVQRDANESTIVQLQNNNKQLKDANQKWSVEWKKMAAQHESQITELQQERDQLQRDLAEYHIQDEQRKHDFDKMLLDLKKKLEDAEVSKEDALNQLHGANLKVDNMQARLLESDDKYDQIRRQNQTMEAEISVLKSGSAYSQSQGSGSSPSQKKNLEEIETENMVLRQQLLLFQDDFQKERHDRAQAQSGKDDLQKENETLKKKIRHFDMRKLQMDAQIQNSSLKVRESLIERDRLKQDIYDLQSKVRNLELANSQLRQQQQQQQREQYQAPIIQSAGLTPTPQPMYQQYAGQQMYQQQPYQLQPPPHNGGMFAASQYTANTGMSDLQAMPQTLLQQSQQNRISAPALPAQQQMYPGASGHELLPGAWNCPTCTYSNYPKRTVCEICGYIRSPSAYPGQTDRNQISGTLLPRGEETRRQLYQYQNTNNLTDNRH